MTQAVAPHALHKLTVALMFMDATPVVKIVLVGLLATGLAALVILLLGLARSSKGMAGAARFLESAMVAAPIAALFGAACGLITSFLGIANTNVSNLAVAAPGIAEAILSVATGLLALLFAVIAYRVVKPRSA
ncbi:MAG TPA: MotA/TolQ/ExbB proton channel family protein [Caulobacteraceae bacterium]